MAKEDWKVVDREALAKAIGDDNAEQCWAQYQRAKQAYRAYKAERDAFEHNMQTAFDGMMPNGMELKFGYNFGRLSIAVGPITAKAKAKPQDDSNLADWIADRATDGCRV